MLSKAGKSRSRLAIEHLEDRNLLSAAPPMMDLAAYRLDPTGEVDQSRILVRFRSDDLVVNTESILPGTQLGRDLLAVPGLYEVMLPEHVSVEQAVAAYSARPDVLYAEPNYLAKVQLIPNDTGWFSSGMYGLRQIKAPEAWDYWVGHQFMTAADFDTGVAYDHPDLCRNIWLNNYEIPASRLANLVDVDGDYTITFWDLNDPINQGPGKITDQNGDGRICGSDVLRPMTGDTGGWADGVDGEGNGFTDDLIGWNMAENNNNPLDTNGHGTHTAGTMGAVGNNAMGVVGVNWRLQVMPVKINIGSSGSISINAAILATYYAAWFQVPVSNNSWGGGGVSTALKDAISWAATQGHLYVAAAGNNGSDNNFFPFYPANYGVAGGHGAALNNVISVMANNSADNRASFSNYGTNTVHLSAPGESILSTYLSSGYQTLSGTSMAAPHVSGAIAYLNSVYYGASYQDIKARILNGVDVVPGMQNLTSGRLNLFNSLVLSGPGGSPGQGANHNPRQENPDDAGTPGFLGASAGLIVDSLIEPGADLVQQPVVQEQQSSVAAVLAEDAHDALFQRLTETPVLGDNTSVLADRADGLFDWNLELGL